MTHLVQHYDSAAVQHIKSFVHLQVPMRRNARPGRHLLCAHGQPLRTRRRAKLDVDVAVVAKMYQVFPSTRAEHISWWCPQSLCGILPKQLAHAKSSRAG
jgi:hypothetical protein